MRELVYDTLRLDSGLELLGVPPGAYYSGDVDTPPERPFINLRWGTTIPGQGAVNVCDLVVWVHDRPGDFMRVDTVLMRIRTLLLGLAPAGRDGRWITCVEWSGDSGDLTDPGHETITRNATFNIVGSGR